MFAIMLLCVMVIIMGFAAFIGYKNMKPAPYNGLLWIHPLHQLSLATKETVIPINRKPEGQRPFYFQYAWYFIGKRPLYLWYEKDPVIETRMDGNKKITVKRYPIAHWEPDKPADYHLSTNEEGKTNVAYVTPNELFDNTDWECARRFETVKGKWGEAVKLGMAAIMVVVCIIGIVMMVDMINKPDPKHAADIINLIGGLL